MDRWDRLEFVEGTSQRARLLENETELLLIPKVGLYDRDSRVDGFQEGSLILTNHRLLWKDALALKALSLSLSLVERYSGKSGFLTSSPKVILYLRPKEAQSPFHPVLPLNKSPNRLGGGAAEVEAGGGPAEQGWKCHICESKNTFDMHKCSECGIIRPPARETGSSIKLNALPTPSGWTCEICTFYNGLEGKSCEMCETPRSSLAMWSPPQPSDVPASSTSGPPRESMDFIKLSFRGVGPSNFLAHLHIVLQKEEWKYIPIERKSQVQSVVGVAGLLKKVELDHKDANSDLDTAFSDLDALMEKASEMVKLADSISTKLASKIDSVEDAVEKDFRSLLKDLGMTGAVLTKGVTGDSFHIELAQQLADFVQKIFDRKSSCGSDGGSVDMVPLVDLYCLFNRARGTHLVSPHDLHSAALLFDRIHCPVMIDRLSPTGLLVVQRKDRSEMISRIAERLAGPLASVNALEISQEQHLSLSIALLYLDRAEANGTLCRDESPTGEIRFYRNYILDPC